MKFNVDISNANVWKSILTPEEYSYVEDIFEKMQSDPIPDVKEFLSTIRAELEKNRVIPEVAVLKIKTQTIA